MSSFFRRLFWTSEPEEEDEKVLPVRKELRHFKLSDFEVLETIGEWTGGANDGARIMSFS